MVHRISSYSVAKDCTLSVLSCNFYELAEVKYGFISATDFEVLFISSRHSDAGQEPSVGLCLSFFSMAWYFEPS